MKHAKVVTLYVMVLAEATPQLNPTNPTAPKTRPAALKIEGIDKNFLLMGT